MVGLGSSTEKNIPSVEHVQVVAFYDPESGRIKHLHMVTTLSGATPLTQDEAIAEAKTHARRRNPNIDDLAVALSNDPELGRCSHTIDPKTKAFVPMTDEK